MFSLVNLSIGPRVRRASRGWRTGERVFGYGRYFEQHRQRRDKLTEGKKFHRKKSSFDWNIKVKDFISVCNSICLNATDLDYFKTIK